MNNFPSVQLTVCDCQWLESEALANNPKIEVTPDGRYMFKPPYKIRDKMGLKKLLRQTDLKGLGGILLDDIQESLPDHEKILKVYLHILSLSAGKVAQHVSISVI